MQEASRALATRPELQAWFQQEQAWDRAFATHLSQIPVPDRLLEEILAAAKISQRPLPHWQRLPWLAAAEMLALLGIAAIWMQPSTGSVPLVDFQHDMVVMLDQMKSEGFGLDHETDKLLNISAWLGKQGAPQPYVLQKGTRTASPRGCCVLEWHGQKVTMICFRRGDQEAHLFVVPRAVIAEAVSAQKPLMPQQDQGYPVTHWMCRKCVYVIVGDAPGTALEQFL
jgi:hypothetical protein